MQMTILTAVIYPDEDGDWLVAQNPETGTTTQGKTVEEALANLKETTELYLSELPLPRRKPALRSTIEVEAADGGNCMTKHDGIVHDRASLCALG